MISVCSWNINGLRSILKKDFIKNNKPSKSNTFINYLNNSNYDIVCLNETKIDDKNMNSLGPILDSYPYSYHSHSVQKLGYSGVAIYSRIEPIKQLNSFNDDEEGRVITLEYKKFILICVYTPNSGSKLNRLQYRTEEWDTSFRTYVKKLQKIKPIMIVGDLNVAYEDIDIHKPEIHRNKSAGFTDQERSNFKKLLDIGLVDTYRYLHPTKKDYTYFDYRSRARSRNAGWRIDYILVSNILQESVQISIIESTIYGSDHLPIVTSFNLHK